MDCIARGHHQPGSTELEWFTTSSRDSLRHLTVIEFDSTIFAHIAKWGDNLTRLDLQVFHWIETSELAAVVASSGLRSLREFMIGVPRFTGNNGNQHK